jgi:hypothetical protein
MQLLLTALLREKAHGITPGNPPVENDPDGLVAHFGVLAADRHGPHIAVSCRELVLRHEDGLAH